MEIKGFILEFLKFLLKQCKHSQQTRGSYGVRYKWYEQIFMCSGVGRKYGGRNGTEILYVQYIFHYSH